MKSKSQKILDNIMMQKELERSNLIFLDFLKASNAKVIVSNELIMPECLKKEVIRKAEELKGE